MKPSRLGSSVGITRVERLERARRGGRPRQRAMTRGSSSRPRPTAARSSAHVGYRRGRGLASRRARHQPSPASGTTTQRQESRGGNGVARPRPDPRAAETSGARARWSRPRARRLSGWPAATSSSSRTAPSCSTSSTRSRLRRTSVYGSSGRPGLPTGPLRAPRRARNRAPRSARSSSLAAIQKPARLNRGADLAGEAETAGLSALPRSRPRT